MSETVTINGREFPVVGDGRPVTKPAPKAKKASKLQYRKVVLSGEPVKTGVLMIGLPPPSVNGLFANARKGRRKTLRYSNWCQTVDAELRAQEAWHVPDRVAVTIRVGGSSADIDNTLKGPLDALVRTGRIMDDRLVMEARAIHDQSVVGTLIEIRAAA